MMQRIRPTGPPSKVIILRVISALVLVVAGSASAQTVEGVADSTLVEMIPDEVMAEVAGDLPEDLPEPNAAAVEIPAVDMWSTGVSPTGVPGGRSWVTLGGLVTTGQG